MSLNPRQLFLIDGLGALLSTLLLGVILVKFEYLFGMPRKELYFLSSVAGVFTIYDFICYWKIKDNWQPFLKVIAIANLMYCCFSIAIVFYSYQKLTHLGFIYFLLEFIILIILVRVELKRVYQNKDGEIGDPPKLSKLSK
ncbi:MAG: hypothetical protein ACI94Y_000420 [Maribacter sp.]|jgi:hypothetical protein